jgi:hypothetical protein
MIKILNIKIQLKLVFLKKKFKNYNFIIVPLPKKKITNFTIISSGKTPCHIIIIMSQCKQIFFWNV